MNSFDVYKDYVSLKLHFTDPKFDFFTSRRKFSPSAYESRKDKHYFQKLAKHRDPRGVLIANLLSDPGKWIGAIIQDEDTYVSWEARVNSLSYTCEQEASKLSDEDLSAKDGHPEVIRRFLAGEIHPETLVVLLAIVPGLEQKWEKRASGDPVFEDVMMKLKKYRPFLEIDKARFNRIMLEAA